MSPASIPVAIGIGIGIGVSVAAAATNLGLIVYGISLGRQEEYEEQKENSEDGEYGSTPTYDNDLTVDIIKNSLTEIKNLCKKQHDKQINAILQTQRAVNTHAEKTGLLLNSMDSKLDYHAGEMHENKKHKQGEELTGQPDGAKVKISKALVTHGIHAPANKEHIEHTVEETTDEDKPIRKRLRA